MTAIALRPVRLPDLPALRRFRTLPDVRSHLRHPTPPSCLQQLRWWWRVHHDPTVRVWTILRGGQVIGVGGFYYIDQHEAELSLLCCSDREEYDWEVQAGRYLLALAPHYGLHHIHVEVLSTAPIPRAEVFQALGFVLYPIVSDLNLHGVLRV